MNSTVRTAIVTSTAAAVSPMAAARARPRRQAPRRTRFASSPPKACSRARSTAIARVRRRSTWRAPSPPRWKRPAARCPNPRCSRRSGARRASSGRPMRRTSPVEQRADDVGIATAIGRGRWRREHADRRSGDGHRQDLRVSRPGDAVGRQGDRLDRHEAPAGPAFPARHPDRARRARRAGVGGDAQGPRELPVSLLPAAHRRQRPPADAPGHVASAGHHPFRENHAHRRQGRTRERAGEFAGLADGHVHARQLSRPGMPALQGMFRDAGAQRGAAGGHRRRESPPVFRRRDAARHRHGRVAADREHHHLRRSASIARNRDALLRRDRLDDAVPRTRARFGRGRPEPRPRRHRLDQARRRARTRGARRAARVPGGFGAHVARPARRRSSALRSARYARNASRRVERRALGAR